MTDKVIFAKCKKCLRSIVFRGKDSQQIVKDIDVSGWLDCTTEGGGVEFLCPTCAELEEGK